MMKRTIIGISGDAGSFSEEAGLIYAKKHAIPSTLVYLIDMEGVLAAIELGTIDIGVFPVVNNRGGLVRMAFAAMGNHLFKPIDELWLDVKQCLLIKPGTKQIKKIVSHPQAFAQCQQYLKKTFGHAELIAWQDTAKAARDLSENTLSSMCAVIAPARSAKLYGLAILANDIHDDHPNLTAFIIAKRHDRS